MNDSIYAPPKADMRQFGEAGSDGDNAFYVVSIRKFTLLFLLTLGFYQIYWSYKNWRIYKDRCRYAGTEGQDIWPIPRAIFSVFFVHSLFYRIDEYATEKLRPLNWNVDAHATPIVLLLIASTIADRLSYRNIGSPYSDLTWMLLVVPLYFGYRKAQRYINIGCGDPEGISNSKITGANWAWLIVGSIFWVMAVTVLFIPEIDA